MGSGSLIQLSAVGVENVDLTVDAEHTFWKSVYSKHTGFSIEPKELNFTSGSADYGRKATVKIDRQGDMIADIWLVIDTTALNDANHRFVNDFGRAIIQQVAVFIGGVSYDVRLGVFKHMWEELTVPNELHLNQLTGKTPVLADLNAWGQFAQRFYVPIQLWFTDAYSNALPLVGLYQHEVNLDFTFRPYVECIQDIATGVAVTPTPDPTTDGGVVTMLLLVEYVFLENNERNYFARGTHKYMIDQVQHVGTTSVVAATTALDVNLHFNHPTNELIWVFRSAANEAANNHFIFEGEEAQPFNLDAFLGMRLLLNSSERWTSRDPLYFRGVVPKRHHSRIPKKQIYAYSFGLHPEQATTDPSGNINFSRIDNSQLKFTFTAGLTENYSFLLFARSVNWAKIERGLSKLFYA